MIARRHVVERGCRLGDRNLGGRDVIGGCRHCGTRPVELPSRFFGREHVLDEVGRRRLRFDRSVERFRLGVFANRPPGASVAEVAVARHARQVAGRNGTRLGCRRAGCVNKEILAKVADAFEDSSRRRFGHDERRYENQNREQRNAHPRGSRGGQPVGDEPAHRPTRRSDSRDSAGWLRHSPRDVRECGARQDEQAEANRDATVIGINRRVTEQPRCKEDEYDRKSESDSTEQPTDREFFDETHPLDRGDEPFDRCADTRQNEEEKREPVSAFILFDLVREEQAEGRARSVREAHPDDDKKVGPGGTNRARGSLRKPTSGCRFPRVTRFRARRTCHGLRLPASTPKTRVRHP
ncbi:unannotated protein [freshwater metagenome]|uniref:Unannotated protein n=1 Tax=freshwater metagenome TaxID=449393 RepID=A0A6J6J516_9ZZZZ